MAREEDYEAALLPELPLPTCQIEEESPWAGEEVLVLLTSSSLALLRPRAETQPKVGPWKELTSRAHWRGPQAPTLILSFHMFSKADLKFSLVLKSV